MCRDKDRTIEDMAQQKYIFYAQVHLNNFKNYKTEL